KFAFADGYLSQKGELRLRPETETGVPVGLTLAPDGRTLYVAETWGQRVTCLSTEGKQAWSVSLAPPAGPATTDPEGARNEVEATAKNPDAPFPYTCVLDAGRGRLYVSLWAKSTVLVLDAKTGAEVARWPVGEHPNEMAL